LGYNLPDYDTPSLLVNNQVIDTTTKTLIPYKNEFVELLTHPSYILQINRLKPERKTKLEKFLSFFDQSNKTDEDFILDIENSSANEFSDIAEYLNIATLDEEIIRQLEYEEDYEESIEKLENQLDEERRQKEEERKQKEEERKQKEEERRQKEEERKQKEEERRQKEEKELEIKKLLEEIERLKNKLK